MGLVRTRTLASKGANRVAAVNVDLNASCAPGSCLLPDVAPQQILGASLEHNGFLTLRQAILDGQLDLGDPAMLEEMVRWFEGCDAAARAHAAESLKALSLDLLPLLTRLLAHPDPHLRLFGVGLLEFRRDPDVERQLIAVLERDADLRVSAAALDLLCEVATKEAIEPLERLKARFASEAYVQFAVTLAIKRIRES